MQQKNPDPVVMEGVTLIYRNFEGRETQYNKSGSMNFGVILEEGVAQQMEEDGLNVKRRKLRDDEEDPDAIPEPWLPVAVNFDVKPPRVVLITSRGPTNLNDETIGQLDWVDIKNVDIVVNLSRWDVNGAQGIKAYLKTMYITIIEDALEQKYANLAAGDAE